MSILLMLGLGVRVFMILLGLAALLSLAWAKAKRGGNWTSKLKDIWLCHFLFVYGTIQGNVEFLFRKELPTTSILFFAFVFVWTIKGVRNGDFYTKDEEFCNIHH